MRVRLSVRVRVYVLSVLPVLHITSDNAEFMSMANRLCNYTTRRNSMMDESDKSRQLTSFEMQSPVSTNSVCPTRGCGVNITALEDAYNSSILRYLKQKSNSSDDTHTYLCICTSKLKIAER